MGYLTDNTYDGLIASISRVPDTSTWSDSSEGAFLRSGLPSFVTALKARSRDVDTRMPWWWAVLHAFGRDTRHVPFQGERDCSKDHGSFTF